MPWGCGERPPTFPTRSELPDAARRPDGVAIDPSLAPPHPVERADTEQPLVALRAPLSSEAALALLRGFFRAVIREDVDALAELAARDAVAAGSPAAAPPPSSLGRWPERFARLRYEALAGETIFREGDVEIFRRDELVGRRLHRGVAREAMGEEDLLVRVPIVTPKVGPERLLSDEMTFHLRRDHDRYRVVRVVEEFQGP